MTKKIIAALTFCFAFAGCTPRAELKGKVLHLILRDNVRTSDPASVDDIISAEPTNSIYEAPYQYNFDSPTGDVIPSLADGMPAYSKDRKTVTIKFKKGVRFQDDPCFKATGGKGREVKASDYLYGWKRLADISNAPQGFWIFDGFVEGINDYQKKKASDVSGFQALDDYTIRLKLTKPYPQLIYVLTMQYAAPVPREAIETYGKDFTNHPVGTGPFRVVEYNPTSRIRLTRNENFREELYKGQRLPLADGLDFEVVKEEQPRWLNFLQGKFDVTKIPKDNFSAAVQNREITPDLKQKGIYLSIEASHNMWYVSMNLKDKVLGSNKYLRQAIASAVDGKSWLHLFHNDRGSIQTDVNPPSVKDRCGKAYRWTFDLDRAAKLLEMAGFPKGRGLPTFTYDTRRPDMSERQLAEFVQMNLAKIGIRVNVIVNTFPAFLDKMHKGNLQLSKGGWMMDYPDPQNNYQLLYGPNKAPGPNDANFENPEYDKVYEKLAAAPAGAERRALACKLEELVQEEAPWAYGIYEDEYQLGQGWLKNWHVAEFVYTRWKYVDTNRK